MSDPQFAPPGLALNAVPQRGRFPFVDAICAIVPGVARPMTFADLAALARWIHRQRGARGLELRPVVASYSGSDTFKAIAVRFQDGAGGADYACTVSIRGRPPEALEAALAAANPNTPEAA